ncbi:hypothetical protein Y032_0014g2447 [Ancylostoma ceylanicum]|nr:hypothetical protein Y032_0014g2447 [Ancylostoma ceylanicum]
MEVESKMVEKLCYRAHCPTEFTLPEVNNLVISVMLFLLAIAAATNIRDEKEAEIRFCFRQHESTDMSKNSKKGCSLRYKMTGDRCEGTITFRTNAETNETFLREDKNIGLVTCSRNGCLSEEKFLLGLISKASGKSGPYYGGDVFLYCFSNVVSDAFTLINNQGIPSNKADEVRVKKLEAIPWPLPGTTKGAEEEKNPESEKGTWTSQTNDFVAGTDKKAKTTVGPKKTKTKAAPGFFHGEIGGYRATFIGLGQIFVVTLAMQIYLLIYLHRMRSNYVLLARSALEQEEDDLGISEEERAKRKKKREKDAELPDDLSGTTKKLVYSLEGSIPLELFSNKTLRKMPLTRRD